MSFFRKIRRRLTSPPAVVNSAGADGERSSKNPTYVASMRPASLVLSPSSRYIRAVTKLIAGFVLIAGGVAAGTFGVLSIFGTPLGVAGAYAAVPFGLALMRDGWKGMPSRDERELAGVGSSSPSRPSSPPPPKNRPRADTLVIGQSASPSQKGALRPRALSLNEINTHKKHPPDFNNPVYAGF